MWKLHHSNEAEVLAIMEALWCFSRSYYGSLIVESDIFNAILWVSSQKTSPWKPQFLFNETRASSYIILAKLTKGLSEECPSEEG